LHKLTKTEGFQILDGVGLLETFYARGYLPELRACFRQLITHKVYIDQRLLDGRLRALGLPAALRYVGWQGAGASKQNSNNLSQNSRN